MWWLVAAGVIALVDWWAVGTGRRPLEVVAKPAAMGLLVGFAASAGNDPAQIRNWVIAGAVFGVLGDVALLGASETAFMVGLGAFLVGHLAYAVGAAQLGLSWSWSLVGVLVTCALMGYRFVSRTVPGAHDHGGSVLAGAVVVYAAVIGAMTVTAWATGVVVAGIGATLFAVSDWVLGYQRFVESLPVGRLGVIVPYHVGQALLIFGLLA